MDSGAFSIQFFLRTSGSNRASHTGGTTPQEHSDACPRIAPVTQARNEEPALVNHRADNCAPIGVPAFASISSQYVYRLSEHVVLLEPDYHLLPGVLGRFLTVAGAVVGVKAVRLAGIDLDL